MNVFQHFERAYEPQAIGGGLELKVEQIAGPLSCFRRRGSRRGFSQCRPGSIACLLQLLGRFFPNGRIRIAQIENTLSDSPAIARARWAKFLASFRDRLIAGCCQSPDGAEGPPGIAVAQMVPFFFQFVGGKCLIFVSTVRASPVKSAESRAVLAEISVLPSGVNNKTITLPLLLRNEGASSTSDLPNANIALSSRLQRIGRHERAQATPEHYADIPDFLFRA